MMRFGLDLNEGVESHETTREVQGEVGREEEARKGTQPDSSNPGPSPCFKTLLYRHTCIYLDFCYLSSKVTQVLF